MATTTHRHDPEFCAPCDIGPFTRNNFFTGKLLLERDFTDEQTYFVDKLRHHHRRLHGWGVVCGLKVKQHGTPGCRDRFVCIEPGTAIDCCGHEIVLRDEDCVDLSLLPALQGIPANDDVTHTLQICLRYRECGTEPIPVLYDECGCDDTRCLPNRILESYEVDVKVDPPAAPDLFSGPRLVRGVDIGFADARHVRFNATDGLLYVVAGTNVHAVDRASRAILRSHDLDSDVHALEVSPNGTHLYLVHDDVEGGGGLLLTVLQASDFSVTSSETVPDGATPVATAVSRASDGRFLVLVGPASAIQVYEPDLETATPTAPTEITVPADRSLLAIAPDGATAFVAGRRPRRRVIPPRSNPSISLPRPPTPRSAGSCRACNRARSRPSPSRGARCSSSRPPTVECGRSIPPRPTRSDPTRSPARVSTSRAIRGCTRSSRPAVRAACRSSVSRGSSPTCRIRSAPRSDSRATRTTLQSRPTRSMSRTR